MRNRNKRTAEHNKKIGESVRITGMSGRFKNKIVRMEFKDGRVRFALNGALAANYLNCSRQLVYQVLSDNPTFCHFKTAKGAKLTLVTKKQYEKEVAQLIMRDNAEMEGR